MKIEAMTEKQIADMVRLPQFRVGTAGGLIMAYAVAQSQREKLEFYDYHAKVAFRCSCLEAPSGSDVRHEYGDFHWLQAVLLRIGWPDDKGAGASEDKQTMKCKACNGDGWITDHSDSHYGKADDDCGQHGCPVQRPCEKCSGTGQIAPG